MKGILAVIAVILIMPLLLQAEGAQVVELSYDRMEKLAQENSFKLKSISSQIEGEQAREQELKSQLMPKLNLEGFYRYNTNVPEMRIPSLGLQLEQGANNNYSIGPTVYWTLWDNGGRKMAWRSQQEAVKVKQLERESVARQIDLLCAKTYFQLISDAEQMRNIADALALAEKQYNDILINVKAGAKSRMDQLRSHTQVLSRKRQLEQVKNDFIMDIRELNALTGRIDLSPAYLPENLKGKITADPGTIYVVMDPLDPLYKKLSEYAGSDLSLEQPDLAIINELISSASFAAESARAGSWPRITVSVRSSIDYPNGTNKESVNQNSFNAGLSMPIFESGETKARAERFKKQEESAIEQKYQKETDLKKLWEQTQNQITYLTRQDQISETMVREAEELSSIVYKSYLSGWVTYLEVNDADYRLLDTRIQQTRIKVQILMQYAILRSLVK